MKNIAWISAAVLVVGSVWGCGGKEQDSHTTASAKNAQPVPEQSATQEQLIVDAATPQVAITKFLDALRGGDDKTAAALLTTKAREETAAHNMVVEPPGAPNATYTVGRVEHPQENPDAAYVSCVWSEKFDGGEEESYEVVWVLHRESSGWRIAGMATQLSENEDPVFLDFEDLTAMENKVREAEVASRQGAANPPQNSANTTVR